MRQSLLPPDSQKGQALLIVVLIMVVSLTIGLAVVSRSIVNLRTSSEEENSQRAFSAAEAGVERAIRISGSGLVISDYDLENNASIKKVEIEQVSGTEFVLNAGNSVDKDNGGDIGLSQDYPGYTSPQNISNLAIYWGSPSDDCTKTPVPSAIELIVISGSVRSPESRRYTYDPCSRGNNFSSPQTGSYIVSGKTFRYRTPSTGSDAIGSINNGLVARVIPLYTNSLIGVTSDTALPFQGKVIKSTGASGGAERKITYFQGYPQLPSEFFQYVLFSP